MGVVVADLLKLADPSACLPEYTTALHTYLPIYLPTLHPLPTYLPSLLTLPTLHSMIVVGGSHRLHPDLSRDRVSLAGHHA